MRREFLVSVSVEDDDDPDLSWLDQSDSVMGEGFQAQATERKDSFGIDWSMIGIVVKVKDLDEPHNEGRDALWGVESDSGEEYLRSVTLECIREAMGQVYR